MLASELPVEIMLCIAESLELRDKARCCLVCKGWLPGFQKSLFEIIVLNKIGINKLLDPTSPASNLLLEHGHNTRTLRIRKDSLLHNRKLYAFQKHFPNLECFRWELSRLIEPFVPNDIYGWNMWTESLTKLELHLSYHVNNDQDKIFNLVRLNLCRLKQLKLCVSGSDMHPFTFDDFELLNDQLPELMCMSITARFEEMNYDELSKVKEVKPRPCFKSLQIHIGKSTYEWIYYIAIKYPNISTVGLLYFGQALSLNLLAYQTLTRLAELPRPLQQLERIDMTVHVLAVHIYQIFLNQLHGLNIPIKHVWLAVASRHCLDNASKDYARLTAKPWANTLKELSITYYSSYSGSFHFFNHDDYYPCLVDLNITVYGAVIFINVVLANRPSLKTIKVTCGLVSYGLGSSTPSIKHGLRDLSLLKTKISTKTLTYISIYCDNLKNMTLDRVKILESQNIINSPHCIDMSSTHFKKLRIKHIEFIKQTKSNISVFLFPSSEEKREKIKYRRQNPTENVWACFHDWESYDKGLIFDVQKKGEEAEKIEEYFRAFSYMSRRLDTMHQSLELVDRLSLGIWASFLPDGYVTLKYGSVEDLVIGP
ncbi:hypothetical protein J3Q64DRAFT_1849116 [Phycomyces blakesleeanus]